MKKNNNFAIEDIARFRLPGNLMYSPDGMKLAFFAETPDREKNTIRYDTWLADENEAFQLTYSPDAVPLAWQDNEHLILKRSSADILTGYAQLVRIGIYGGEAEPLCILPLVPVQLRRLNETQWLAVCSYDSHDPDACLDSDDTAEKKLEKRKKESDYTVIDETPFAFDGAGIRNGLRYGLFLVEFDLVLKIRRLTKPEISVKELYVSDGIAVFTADHYDHPEKMFCPLLYLYDGKRVKMLYGRRDRKMLAPFVMNGEIYLLTSDMKEYGVKETPWITCFEKGRLKQLVRMPYSFGNTVNGDLRPKNTVQYQTHGGNLYCIVTVEDHSELMRFDREGHGETVWKGSGNLSSLAVGNNGISVIHSDWKTPSEVFELKDGVLKQRTHLNDDALAGRKLHELKRVDYVSDGLQLHGWAVLPHDYNPAKKYPGVLDMHGGPRVAYGEVFSFEKQLLADHGYIVFYTNVRGSDGRDDAFADIRGQFGTPDYSDFMSFTDAVLKEYSLDPERLCVMGLSYGGYMSSRIITKTDRFCCAMIQAPVISWISMAYTSDIGSWFAPDQTGAESLSDWKALWETSPLKYADQADTPALFILGREDWRCPQWEGMQMMQALTVRGVETRMVLFEGGSHNMHYTGVPGIKIRRLKEMLSWFGRHTGR